MHLARYSISSTLPTEVFDARFDSDAQIFTASTAAGFAIYRTWPLTLLRKRQLTEGTLTFVVPYNTSNLLFLVGGGRSPLYPPNKVVLWDEAIGREVAELEFSERVRGLACRRGWLAVSLRRRVVVFQVGEKVIRYAEWDTCDNTRGLLAIATATDSTLLAIAGRQTGHVQLIHLPPCPPPPVDHLAGPSRRPVAPRRPAGNAASIIVAHTTALTALSVLPSGRLLATTSTRGTLVRVWDAYTGKLQRELRRGTDKAVIYGVAFRPDERELCVWSDKGTVHVFSLANNSTTSNQLSAFSPLSPFISLPKYFDSEWSYAQYRIPSHRPHVSFSPSQKALNMPDEERCTVSWIEVPPESSQLVKTVTTTNPEYQLVALTYSGGWYRLAVPYTDTWHASESPTSADRLAANRTTSSSPSGGSKSISPSTSSSISRSKTHKRKESEGKERKERDCRLVEFRRYGRWDGWG